MSTLELQKCLGHVVEAGMTMKKVELSQKLPKTNRSRKFAVSYHILASGPGGVCLDGE